MSTPPGKSLQSNARVALENAFVELPTRSGLLMAFSPSFAFLLISHTPSPPVVHGVFGNSSLGFSNVYGFGSRHLDKPELGDVVVVDTGSEEDDSLVVAALVKAALVAEMLVVVPKKTIEVVAAEVASLVIAALVTIV